MKPLAHLLLLLALCWSSTLTDAYFYVPNFMNSLPFQAGSAFATRNNSLIVFGGQNATTVYTNNLYQLTQTSDSFTWEELPQNNRPPGNLYGQAVISSTGQTMLLLGGLGEATVNQLVPIQMYSYNFSTQTWGAWANNNNANVTDVPYNRQMFSASYDNSNTVYIFGGSLNMSAIYQDFYALDTSTMSFTELPNPGQGRYGHTSSFLRYVHLCSHP